MVIHTGNYRYEKQIGRLNGVIVEVSYVKVRYGPETGPRGVDYSDWEFSFMTKLAKDGKVEPLKRGGPRLKYEYVRPFGTIADVITDANEEMARLGCGEIIEVPV